LASVAEIAVSGPVERLRLDSLGLSEVRYRSGHVQRSST